MKKIPTAKQFADQYDWDNSSLDIEELLRDFAKLHVKAALKAAAKNVKIETITYFSPDPSQWDKVVDESSILNAYPDNLIQ